MEENAEGSSAFTTTPAVPELGPAEDKPVDPSLQRRLPRHSMNSVVSRAGRSMDILRPTFPGAGLGPPSAVPGLATDSMLASTRVERLIREREMRRTSSVLSFEGGNPVDGTSTSSAQGSPKGVGPERMRRASENPSQLRVRATHLYEDILSPVASASSVQHNVWLPASIDSFNSLMETERMTVSPALQPPTADPLLIPEGGVPMPHPLSSPPSSTQSASMLLGGSVVGVPGLGGEAGMVGQLMKKPGRLSRESFQDPSNPSLSGQHPPSVTSESSQRLLVVANRLPVSVSLLPSGEWHLERSAGGLVSALMGIHSNYQTTWVGWPGMYVPPGVQRDQLIRILAEHNCHPVFINDEMLDLYYNGYCNNVLWPLFHYVPLPLEARLAETKSLQNQWKAYVQTNHLYRESIMELYEEGDVVWAHDYHLLLLPKLLKELKPNMKVGWFLHTPFPSSEIYRALPRREEILRGVLKADLIGFHTYDYARHFMSACTRILGLEGTPEGVEDNGQVTRVAAFPIGIDPERFTSALETDIVKAHMADLRERFAGRKVMLGVDRLDMIKGIPQKLLAYEMFLDENPEWCDKVLLVQIAVPSRSHVPEYQRLASLVHEMVGRINGRFGTLGSMPIHHLDRSLTFHELVALYALTDVALVTPVRDGMNLVSYEVVACQSKNAGVLVLSEFAGAAQSLGAGALLVNPWNVSDLADAIKEALFMGDAERRELHRQNFMHVTVHTSHAWADTFISELNDTHVEAALRTMHTPPLVEPQRVVQAFCESRERLVVVGYNATLLSPPGASGVTQQKQKRSSRQGTWGRRVHPAVGDALATLAATPHTTVVIFSASSRDRLSEAFEGLPVWLAAENGVFIRPPLPEQKVVNHNDDDDYDDDNKHWITTSHSMNLDWLESVQLVFDYFCERTPRSFVETRETSLVWNFKYADPEFGMIQARDLLQHLVTGPISNSPVDVVQGSRSVEVRAVGVSKTSVMDHIVMGALRPHDDGGGDDPGNSVGSARGGRESPPALPKPVDFVLCMGHFLGRDEDIFTYFEDCVLSAFHKTLDKEKGKNERGGPGAGGGNLRGGLSGLLTARSDGRSDCGFSASHSNIDGPTISTAAAAAAGFGANSNSNDWQKRRSQEYAYKAIRSAPTIQAHRPYAHTTTCGFTEDCFKNELRVERLGSSPNSTDGTPVPSRRVFLGDAASRQMAGEGLGDDYTRAELDSANMRQASVPERPSAENNLQTAPGRVLSAPEGSASSKKFNKPFPSSSSDNVDGLPVDRNRSRVWQGSDRQNQSMGRSLVAPKHLYTCTVSRKRSQARYYLPESSDVVDLLGSLAMATTSLNAEGWLRKSNMRPSGSTFF